VCLTDKTNFIEHPVTFPYFVHESIQPFHRISAHSIGIQASSIFETDKNVVFVCPCHLYW